MAYKKPVSANPDLGPPVAYFETVKVIRTAEPIFATGKSGLTFGQALDRHLEACAREGIEVQSVKIDMAEGEWAGYAAQFQPQPAYAEAVPAEDWR